MPSSDPTAPSPLAREWLEVAARLGVQVVAPYRLELSSGVGIEVDVLLRSFGGSEGMLLVSDASLIEPHLQLIDWDRYGFTTLPEPEPDAELDIDAVIEVLRDWGWSGGVADRPEWLGPEPTLGDEDEDEDD